MPSSDKKTIACLKIDPPKLHELKKHGLSSDEVLGTEAAAGAIHILICLDNRPSWYIHICQYTQYGL